MKRLLVVTGALETGGGTMLMGWPSAVATVLFGVPLGAPAAVSLYGSAGQGFSRCASPAGWRGAKR